ncbi:autotransporter assembly complex protein TamA [Desulfuromonas acetexigens]|uniref:autotransporter assembly complex protein TamA n=1 Tax=Trichloromonas acetexigens TaxID=38815 RepID=UPI0030B81061
MRLPGRFFLFRIVLIIFWLIIFSATARSEPLSLEVTGITGELLENVRAALTLPTDLAKADGTVERHWLTRFVGQVPDKVGKALEPFGYFATITSTQLENQRKNQWLLKVKVLRGEPVRVTSLRVVVTGAGAEEKRLQRLVAEFPLREGDILRQDHYERAKGELKASALDLGYLQADFPRHVIRVDRGRRSAEIELELATGPRLRFGKTLIHGAPDFPEWFLLQHLAYAEGDFFSHDKLGQTQFNFLDSDRFRDVLLTPLEELTDEEMVPVSVQLTPRTRHRLRPGVGFGTDTGARLSLRYRDNNAFHRAHLLDADLLLAERRQSLVASYVMPNRGHLESRTEFSVGYQAEDVETYESSSLFAEARQVWGLGQGYLGSVYLRLLQEDYRIADEDRRSRLTIPGLRLSRRQYSDPIRPRRGSSFALEARGAHRWLASDISLLQFLVSGNVLLELPGRWTLFARTEGGTTLQDEPLADVPTSLRFFAGGDQSVRGYAYQSLGPQDANGDVIGGKHLGVASLELERAFLTNWGASAFYDAGNAFNNLSDIDWAQGAGLGVRYYTPVGPIKVDLARQIGEPNPSWRLHVSVGFAW